MPAPHSLELQLPPELVTLFFPLFQEGVEVEVEVGSTVRTMLGQQFGINNDYQSRRITTIFLNHKAVDDAATALVAEDATLALSGAMPGLVGATMRTGGHLSTMREGITYRNPEQVPQAKRGKIRLKLFNLLLQELVPHILRRGILLSGERLITFFTQQPESFRPLGTWLDGQQVAIEKLLSEKSWQRGDELLQLKVQFGDQAP